jgi:hypothetical protein
MSSNTTTPTQTAQLPEDLSFRFSLSLSNNRTTATEEVSFLKTWKKVKAHLMRKELQGQYFRMRSSPSLDCISKKFYTGTFNKNLIITKEKQYRCKSWACPECSKSNGVRVRKLLEKVIELNDLQYFFTLTIDPKKLTREEQKDTHKYITDKFHRLITYLNKYVLSEKIKYIWVVEYQKNGNAHLHGMWNVFLDIQELKKWSEYVGLGFMVWNTKARNIEATRKYVSKYLTKSQNDPNARFKFFQKRYSISRSCVRSLPQLITSKYNWWDLFYSIYKADPSITKIFADKETPYSNEIFVNFFDPPG